MVKMAHARYENPRQQWKLRKMGDQKRAQSYLCNSPHTHRLMRPFPFYLLIGKFTYSALRKTHQGFSCKKTSLQSRQDGSGRFPGRILQQLQTQSVPDDGYLKKQPWELTTATLIRIEMNSMERGKCTLLLPMCCKFKYFYQVEEAQATMTISDHSRTTRRGQTRSLV